jgi:hypothetical protein
VGEGRVLLDTRDNAASEVRVAACKLICKGGKDVFELLSFEVISGTEKAGAKETVFGDHV